MTRVTKLLLALTALPACSTNPGSLAGDDDFGTESAAVESYFCVDHPCPDLHPRKYRECNRPHDNQHMVVAIENLGLVSAGPSKATFVVRYYGVSETYDVGPVPATSTTDAGVINGKVDLSVLLPTGCQKAPGCSWELVVDEPKSVTEMNGTNNRTMGACIFRRHASAGDRIESARSERATSPKTAPHCGTRNLMIDHTGLDVSDPAKSRRFYEQALAPLGYKVMMEVPTEFTGGAVVLGMGVPPKPDFWIHQGTPQKPPLHIAFRADNRALVDAFYQAAMAAGGKDNGPPGLRPHYHKDYYGAFVLDPDGHNIEACCHTPA